jgi:phage baseplate assembly protein W
MAINQEDGNLSSSPRVTKIRPYSDIDLTFGARTATDGDVFRKTDAASVKQALKNLLLTNRFEKPYRPAYGANLSGLLFELADADTGNEIASRIKNTVTRYEPRVKILKLKVISQPDYNKIKVLIEFRVVNTGIIDVLQLVLGGADVCDPPFNPAPPQLDFTGDRILSENLDELLTEAGGFISFDDDAEIYLDIALITA